MFPFSTLPRSVRIGTAIRYRLLVPLAIISVVTGVSGCGNPLDSAIKVIQDAESQIQNAPGTWQGVLSDTLGQLHGGFKQALDEVQGLYDHVITEAQTLTFCVTDYFGRRADEGLAAILHNLKPAGHPAPAPIPTVCNTNPSNQITAGVTSTVVFSGYDLPAYAAPSDAGNHYSASIYYGDQEAKTNFGSVSYTGPYQVVVAFQPSSTTALDPNQNPRLVLKWSKGNVAGDGGSSSLPIVFPPPAHTQIDSVEVKYHVAPGLAQICEKLHDPGGTSAEFWQIRLPAGWKVDLTQGDAGHSGITLAQEQDNAQARTTKSTWDYQAVSDNEIRVSGLLCAASFWGPGAIYDLTYNVHMIAAS